MDEKHIPQLLAWREACAALAGDGKPASRSTLDRLVRAGRIPVCRPSAGIVRYPVDGIAAYLASVTFPRKAA